MRFIQILPRTDGDNTRRVDGLVAAEIVGANMVEVDRLRDARHLVDVAQETMQVRAKLPSPLVVHSSPSSRCRLLAESLAGQDVRLDSRLLELNFGAWELQRWDDIGLGSLNAWTEDVAYERCPGGESYLDVYHRAAAFWHDCIRERPERAAIVTHGGVIRALVAYMLDMPLEKSLRVNVDFGGVTKISFWQDVPIIGYINR